MDADEQWLRELLASHVTNTDASTAAAARVTNAEADEWLQELLSCHRAASGSVLQKQLPPAGFHGSTANGSVPAAPWNLRERSRSPARATAGAHQVRAAAAVGKTAERHAGLAQGRCSDDARPAPPRAMGLPRRLQDWVRTVPADVLSLSRTFEVMGALVLHEQMELRLSKSLLAGAQLAHAISIVNANVNSLTRFKFGITSSPIHRWENTSYGYSREKYHKMIILNVASQPDASCMLEASLIQEFGKMRGCQNVARGGEGKKCLVPCFTYLVVQQLC